MKKISLFSLQVRESEYLKGMTANAMTDKLSKMTIEQLGEIASTMFNNTTNEAGIILDAALEVLESKMSESDFVRFCEKLSA